MSVKSVYNFVPAPNEKEVFTPDWAEQVNHDIPFSDGESGEIEIKITAETPIFIRNGHSKEDAELFKKTLIDPSFKPNQEEQKRIDQYLSFSNYNGKYFIPATSLKGMFRNVLEIITSSKINPNLVNNDRYSFRDLTRNSLYMKNYKTNEVKAGWLKEIEDGSWTIHECEDFCHIHHAEIDKALGTSFRNDFLNRNPKEKTAVFKYNSVKKPLTIKYSVTNKKNKRVANYIDNGEPNGVIVLTGQSSKRKEEKNNNPSGKVHEFVFSTDTTNEIIVSKEQQKDFKFIYLDHDPQNISTDWKFWKNKLKKGESIPVFFMANGNNLLHFGLSFMYKLPYKNSVHEMEPIEGYDNKKDLAEIIFGSIEKEDSLRGRVFIGHAISENAKPVDVLKKEIFGGPKASYFPFYLKQDNAAGYVTYQNLGTIRGYKRYPVRNNLLVKKYSEKQLSNKDVFSYFIPLKEGAEFNFKIRFHNLRKVEIGALLSAITFHSNSTTCFHSLGGGKPFGYGKLKLREIALNGTKYSISDYLTAFEEKASPEVIKSRLVELLSMSSNQSDKSLDYPTLDMENNKNDFQSYKNEKVYLPEFSTINRISISTFKEKNERRLKEEQDKLQAENNRRKEEQELNAYNIVRNSVDIAILTDFITRYPYGAYTAEIKTKLESLRKDRNKAEAEDILKENLTFKNQSFKFTKDYLNERYKKLFKYSLEFTDTQKSQIENQLKTCWEKDIQSFYKKKNLVKFPGFPWSDIIKWLGEERAKSLYDELTNKEK